MFGTILYYDVLHVARLYIKYIFCHFCKHRYLCKEILGKKFDRMILTQGNVVTECVFLQLMSEFVLSALLCLLIDWILLKDPGIATLNQE